MSIRDKFGSWVFSKVLKSFGTSQAARLWLSGEDATGNAPERPNKPYAQIDIVFACIDKLVKSIAGLNLMLSTADDKIIESGPAFELLFNNPLTTFEKFITETVGHYTLSRDVFWIFTEFNGGAPNEILVVSGTQMHPVTSDGTATGQLVAWEFRAGNKRARFDLSEVHQIKNFNPYNKFHGIGPTSAGKLSMSQSYQASLFNESSLANAAEPGLIVTLPGNLSSEKVRDLRSQVDARHKGAAKAKRTMVLTAGADVKTLTLDMVKIQLVKLKDLSDNRICSTFGVPPAVVGLVTEAQYAHGPAQQDYVCNTVIPFSNLIASNITTGILSRFYPSKHFGLGIEPSRSKSFHGSERFLKSKFIYRQARTKAVQRQQKLFSWFDTDDHPVIQAMHREVSEKVLKFTEAGVPLNSLISAHNLPYEEPDWGNDWWIGMGQVPARYILEEGLEGVTGPSLPEGEGEEEDKGADDTETAVHKLVRLYSQHKQELTNKDDEAARLRIWRNWVISWAGIEREFRAAMRTFFLRQERELLTKLKKALEAKKDVTKDGNDDIIARVVFDLKKEHGKIKVINRTFFGRSTELGIRQVASEAGMTGDELKPFVETAKRDAAIRQGLELQSKRITNVNVTTQRRIASQLREGLQSGEGLNDLTQRVRRELGSNRARALGIARTQTSGAVSRGRNVAMKQAGTNKNWLTSGDSVVRDSHRQAGTTYADGIPAGQAFFVGGEYLQHPGDPAGSAANIANCRCVSLAVKAGKSFPLDRHANMEFYSYQQMKADKSQGDKDND